MMSSPYDSNIPFECTAVDFDEQYARDVQLAYDLQAKEERRLQRLRQRSEPHPSTLEDGFSRGALNADHMLFVSCTMDDRQVEMLVDTGASTSAMSVEMVHKLGLQSKMNTAISGNAAGVGTSSILGILENVKCTIGHVEFRLFFMVLEGAMPYCILGLDQMRRFKCQVDLDDGVLIFGGKDGVRVEFLPKEEASIVAYKMMYSKQNKSNTAAARNEESQSRRGTNGVLGSLFGKHSS